MQTKPFFLVALLCVSMAPIAMYALPQKTVVQKAAPQIRVEYCVFSESGTSGSIRYSDGTKTDLRSHFDPINPALELTKLAQSGWRVVASSNTPGVRYWTLKRTK